MAMARSGYHGKVLKVDLSTGTHEVEDVPEVIYRRYLGGDAG
jgi:aldehyde:ferredoxin oxidoreductase